MGFNSGFKELKLFLRLSNCASVGEKTLLIIKMHGMYIKKKHSSFSTYAVTISQLQNVHTVNDDRQPEIHTAGPSALRVVLVTETCKSISFQTAIERNSLRFISFINSVSNKEAVPQQCKQSIIVFVHDRNDKTECSSY